MVADSPYTYHDLALPPWAGMIAGASSSIVVVEVLTVLERVPSLSPSRLVMVVLMGTLLGLLYASSQMTVPWRGLFAVAVFYGFMLWLLSDPLFGRFLPRDLSAMIQSVWWLPACMAYGLTLALVAGLYQLTHPQSTAETKD